MTMRTMVASLAVLLVEDSSDDVERLDLELRRNGYATERRQVSTGEAMERALAERTWDVICSDYHMPLFGAPAALALRMKMAPDTPFILVSGLIGEAAAVALLKSGADDYVPKQDLSRLATAIGREIREAHRRRAHRAADQERARLLQELAQALRVRDDFLSVASHELRTPLTALRLNIESLDRTRRTDEADTRTSRKIADVNRQVDRLERLVADMASVSEIGPGEVALVIEEVDLCAVVADIAREWQLRYPEVPFTRRLPQRLIGQWDELRVRDMVSRLLSNAFKFGSGKSVEMIVEDRAGSAVITVVDHGIGISREDQARIFDRFGRAVPVANYGGFGLGLWIARNLVEAHGGTLSVESESGKGATFVVRLPRAASAAAAAAG